MACEYSTTFMVGRSYAPMTARKAAMLKSGAALAAAKQKAELSGVRETSVVETSSAVAQPSSSASADDQLLEIAQVSDPAELQDAGDLVTVGRLLAEKKESGSANFFQSFEAVLSLDGIRRDNQISFEADQQPCESSTTYLDHDILAASTIVFHIGCFDAADNYHYVSTPDANRYKEETKAEENLPLELAERKRQGKGNKKLTGCYLEHQINLPKSAIDRIGGRMGCRIEYHRLADDGTTTFVTQVKCYEKGGRYDAVVGYVDILKLTKGQSEDMKNRIVARLPGTIRQHYTNEADQINANFFIRFVIAPLQQCVDKQPIPVGPQPKRRKTPKRGCSII